MALRGGIMFDKYLLLYFHLKGVSNYFLVCFQSRLLQMCCMWERVKEKVLSNAFCQDDSKGCLLQFSQNVWKRINGQMVD